MRDKKIKTPESFIKINKERAESCSFKIKRLRRDVYLRNNELPGGEKRQENADSHGLAGAQNAETFLIK